MYISNYSTCINVFPLLMLYFVAAAAYIYIYSDFACIALLKDIVAVV